ncbi:protein serine/threonine kinase [Mycena polygramma]|nr:protein serine/threonine kinase [Mycena polygramma]
MSTPTSFPDFTGHLVDEGRLQLTTVLGAGNYGTVYKALDLTSPPASPTHLAVKCLGPVAANSTRGSRYDEREIRLHQRCSSHPNVATLHRRFCHEGFLFIVLELSAGGNLFDAVDAGAFWSSEATLREVFLQVVDAVRFCHARGVYHRDLKPENILCSVTGADVRIADFGLATDSDLPTFSAGGSPSYMSPESLTLGSDTETYLPRQSDVWALGVILLNMMSGLYPWRRAHDSDAGFDAFLTDAGYLKGMFPISDPLNDLLVRCFRPVPHTRPTLLQLRTEIAAMDCLFATQEKQPPVSSPALLRPVCLSAPPSKLSVGSALFTASPPASTKATSRPTSLLAPVKFASFDSSVLRPTRSLLAPASSAPSSAHLAATPALPASPASARKSILKRAVKLFKKLKRTVMMKKKSCLEL